MVAAAQAKSRFALPPPVCSTQALNGLDDPTAHNKAGLLYSVYTSILILQIQLLISPGNILTDTHRNNVLAAIWASCSPVKLTHKHDRGWLCQWFGDVIKDLGSFLPLSSLVILNHLYPYVGSKMTAIILGIIVRHKASRNRRENPPEDFPSHSTGHHCITRAISEPNTGKGVPQEGLFQPPLRIQEGEDN